MSEQQTTTQIREALQSAIAGGARAVIKYLDSGRLITPYAIQGEMLSAYDETGNRVRQFRLEFIREATAVARGEPGRPPALDDAQRVTIYLSAGTLAAVDAHISAPGQRAAWIREAIEQRLARQS